MKSHLRILILSLTVGAGHTRAAEAVSKAIRQQDASCKVEILDTFSYANPLLGKLMIGTYMKLIKISPIVYQYLYTRAETKHKSFTKSEFINLLHKLTFAKMAAFLEEFRPDIVICTHPFPLGIISSIKKQMRLSLPIVAVVTDFTVHPFWIFNNVNKYILGTTELKNSMLQLGVEADKVAVTGIPIDPQFSTKLDRLKLLKKFGLKQDLPVLLVMGGGLGLGPLKKIVEALNNTDMDLQLLVVVGKNKALQKTLTEMLPDFKLLTKVYGFIEHIHELMEVADLIITKPGGLTSSECLAKGLPMVILNPIPGQEKRNSDFLTKALVAKRIEDERELPDVLRELFYNPEKLMAMKDKAKSIGKPDSAYSVADCILQQMMTETEGGVGSDNRGLQT